ncbi:protein-arginine kinase activator protein [Rubritalea halochordaticola]|uniref:Protein-arginine kinase activator protein n=1 Tax=Rubritalea halochordaticola TaxID=714537 RepID=A0ABP9UXS4_9BACT
MKCELCDAKATVYYTQLIDGQMKKICLCESCAENKGIMDPSAFSMVDVILDKEPQQAAVANIPMSLDSCDHCGFTLADFKKVGRLGCSHCYTVFRGEVEGMLSKMHRGTTHVGKVPEGMMDALEKKQRLERLKQKLDEAIQSEKYEEAATLRDEIKELEEEAKPSSTKEG